jgi:Arm DNA-binding domain
VKEPIRKIELKGGAVRYRLVVDIGYDENGKRQQVTRTFDKLKEARDELSRIRHQTNEGMYVKPSEMTVKQYLEEYFVGATRGPSRVHQSLLPRRLPPRARAAWRPEASVHQQGRHREPCGLDAHIGP